MNRSIDRWTARLEHLRAIKKARHVEPVLEAIAADQVVRDDRFVFAGRVFTCTDARWDNGWIVVHGEHAGAWITAEYLPFEAVEVVIPRPPAHQEANR